MPSEHQGSKGGHLTPGSVQPREPHRGCSRAVAWGRLSWSHCSAGVPPGARWRVSRYGSGKRRIPRVIFSNVSTHEDTHSASPSCCSVSLFTLHSFGIPCYLFEHAGQHFQSISWYFLGPSGCVILPFFPGRKITLTRGRLMSFLPFGNT